MMPGRRSKGEEGEAMTIEEKRKKKERRGRGDAFFLLLLFFVRGL